jgi:hypothetical protein
MLEAWEDDRALAFAIAEQGRLLCERMPPLPRRADELRRAHRGFGLAGYVASEEMDREERLAVLELCRETGPARPPQAGDDLEAALLLAVHGRALSGRCAPLAGWAFTARLELSSARNALTPLVGGSRALVLVQMASRGGHLRAPWQRTHLAPVPPRLRSTATV